MSATILIVDDDAINRAILENIFLPYHSIRMAENGREGLHAILSEPEAFCAVLLDVVMPEMDGCQAARRIRSLSRPDARTVPIIAVTANAFAEDIAATTAAGMDAHVSKPIDFSILCQTLGSLLEQS